MVKTTMRLAFEVAADKAAWGPMRHRVKRILRRSTGVITHGAGKTSRASLRGQRRRGAR